MADDRDYQRGRSDSFDGQPINEKDTHAQSVVEKKDTTDGFQQLRQQVCTEERTCYFTTEFLLL